MSRPNRAKQTEPVPFFERSRDFQTVKDQISLICSLEVEFPFFRVHESPLRDCASAGGESYINFTGYNYLGFSGHREVSAAAKDAIDRFGTSVSASRIVSGERGIHRELEEAISEFLGIEDCLVFVSGHATNVTVIGHLFRKNDLVIHDELIHNSAFQGAKLSGAARRSFPHNDPGAVREILLNDRDRFDQVVILVEGVYSMDGDLARLPEFVELRDEFDTLLMVDEAHSLGTVGRTGRGISEHFDIPPEKVDLWMGTLSKTLASSGGFIAGSRGLVEHLRYTAPGFVYSVGLSPPDAGAALKSIELLQKNPGLVTALRTNADLFRSLATERRINIGGSAESAIVPVIPGGAAETIVLSHRLLQRGISVAPVLYPAVSRDSSRLRFFLTAMHTTDQIARTVDTVAEEMEVLSASPP